MIRRLLAALFVAVALAGCIRGDANCAELPARIELSLTADRLTPASPAVCRGDDVTLVVSSEVDGVLHIHGYDDAVPATAVSAAEETELVFTAGRSGQFPIELHTNENTVGVAVGIFTVHEP